MYTYAVGLCFSIYAHAFRFVIGVMPTPFERGAFNAQEVYSPGPTPLSVSIDFTYNKDSFDGPLKSLPQKGVSWDGEKPHTWKVSPFWPLRLPYLMIEASDSQKLDADDAYFVVGYPSRQYCWVMARRPEMADDLYASITKRLVEKHQYLDETVNKNLVRVPHSWSLNPETGEYERRSQASSP